MAAGVLQAREAEKLTATQQEIKSVHPDLFSKELLEKKIRTKDLPIDAVLGSITFRPGMQIVDIGAGFGYFTFPMADQLQGTGMVYATEIDEALVATIGQRAAALGYTNISPVHVRIKPLRDNESRTSITSGNYQSGLDPFYRDKFFDIIFLCDVFPYLESPEDFFRELRPALTAHSGRLYIVDARFLPQFDLQSVTDFHALYTTIQKQGDNSPVITKFPFRLREFITGYRNSPEIPADLLELTITSLNQLLTDQLLMERIRNFYYQENINQVEEKEFLQYFFTYNFDDARLARWIFHTFAHTGIFDGSQTELSEMDSYALHTVNMILLTGMFRNALQAPVPRVAPFLPDIYSRENYIRLMNKAGYDFEGSLDILHYYHFLEFSRTN